MSATDGPVAQPARGPRGRVWLYAIAFGLLLVAGYLQAQGNLKSEQNLVQTSIVLSIVATLVAIASVLVPGRRARPVPAATTRSQPVATGNGPAAVAVEDPVRPTTTPREPEPEVTPPAEAEPAEPKTSAEPVPPAGARADDDDLSERDRKDPAP